MKTAVVILNWNGADMLRRFLPSVIAGATSADVKVIVADNASTDESEKVVKELFPSVRWIRLEQNFGFADGYNKALAQVEADYFVLLNSDVEVTPDWLTPLMDYMDRHPEVAACQPKLLSYHHRNTFEYAGACGGFIDRYGYPFCRGRIFDSVEQDCHQYDEPCTVFWATGAALLIRSAVYWEVGGLDGRFFAHMEEVDLCWRLKSRGYEIVCLPQSVVYHVGGGTLSKENPRKTFLNFRNNLLMLYKNLPEKELMHVMTVRTVLDYVAMWVYMLKLDFKNADAIVKARQEFYSIKEDFKADRLENLRKAKRTDIPERMRFSILYQAKLRGRKKFSLLK